MRKNRFRWLSLSKPHYILACLALCLASLLGLSSCADADGLHDQTALLVTFQFTGFGDGTDGDYSVPGNFDGSDNWDNTNIDVVMKDGEGTSSQISVTTSNIQFSLCPVNTWTRPWYKVGTLVGNGFDNTTSDKYWNFYIDGLDLNAGETTILIDGSAGTATPVVQ